VTAAAVSSREGNVHRVLGRLIRSISVDDHTFHAVDVDVPAIQLSCARELELAHLRPHLLDPGQVPLQRLSVPVPVVFEERLELGWVRADVNHQVPPDLPMPLAVGVAVKELAYRPRQTIAVSDCNARAKPEPCQPVCVQAAFALPPIGEARQGGVAPTTALGRRWRVRIHQSFGLPPLRRPGPLLRAAWGLKIRCLVPLGRAGTFRSKTLPRGRLFLWATAVPSRQEGLACGHAARDQSPATTAPLLHEAVRVGLDPGGLLPAATASPFACIVSWLRARRGGGRARHHPSGKPLDPGGACRSAALVRRYVHCDTEF
jgi:hypothetical protein